MLGNAKNYLKDEGIDKLTIVPFGKLHNLPFSALSPKDNPYLVESYAIRTLPSASILAFFTPYTKPEDKILVFGVDLAGAEQEAKLIADIFKPNSTLQVKDTATKERLMKDAPNYSRLHFAGHGVFDYKHPLLSFIKLADGHQNTNDGSNNFHVIDLFQIEEPWDAQLVVLSACESDVTKVTNGEEMIGFERGFLYAGAESFMGSLWSINDEKTVHFMENFYQNLKLGFNPLLLYKKLNILQLSGNGHPKIGRLLPYLAQNDME